MISREIDLRCPLLARGVASDDIIAKSTGVRVRAMQVIIHSIQSTQTIASCIAICAVANQ